MRKFLAGCLLSLSILISTPDSKAAVSVFTGGSTLVIAGLALGAAGGVSFAIGDAQEGDSADCWGFCFLFGAIAGLAFIGAGLVLLDGEQSLEFAPLSKEGADRLKISSAELEKFNAELDQINTLTHHIAGELNEKSTVQEAAQKWSEYRNVISPEAFSAMEKIATQK